MPLNKRLLANRQLFPLKVQVGEAKAHLLKGGDKAVHHANSTLTQTLIRFTLKT